jgi:hypothetical protein
MIVAFIVLSAVTLAAIALAAFALFDGRMRVHAAEARLAAHGAEFESDIAALRAAHEALAAQWKEMPQQVFHLPTTGPRPNLNLGKRSQALRMHRRGDTPEQIAAALEIPLQELELLLKVHRIVISTI